MNISKYYQLQIPERGIYSRIKKHGFLSVVKKTFLKVKQLIVVQNTDIFDENFDGTFSEVDSKSCSVLFEKPYLQREWIFKKKYLLDIVFAGDKLDIEAIESCITDKLHFQIIDSYNVEKAEYNFTAGKIFLTRDEDLPFLQCSFESEIKDLARAQFPRTVLTVSTHQKPKKRKPSYKQYNYEDNNYENCLYIEFSYICSAQGPVAEILKFKNMLKKHKLGTLLTKKKKTPWSEAVPDDSIEFSG